MEQEKNLEVIVSIEPIPERNTNNDIQERILQYINDLKLEPDSKLPSEKQLSNALGVSRVSLRESMKVLEAFGILRVKAGSGWFVDTFSFDSIAKVLASSLDLGEYTFSDVQEVRICLEEYFLPTAINNLLPSDLDHLEKLVQTMEARSKEGKSFYDQDREFHKTLFSRVPNSILGRVLDLFWSIFRYSPTSNLTPEQNVYEATLHRRFVDAIASKDIELVQQRAKEHFKKGDKAMKYPSEFHQLIVTNPLARST